MNIERQKELYLTFKELLERLSNQDMIGQALANALTIDQVEDIEAFVMGCEDMGLDLITTKTWIN